MPYHEFVGFHALSLDALHMLPCVAILGERVAGLRFLAGARSELWPLDCSKKHMQNLKWCIHIRVLLNHGSVYNSSTSNCKAEHKPADPKLPMFHRPSAEEVQSFFGRWNGACQKAGHAWKSQVVCCGIYYTSLWSVRR